MLLLVAALLISLGLGEGLVRAFERPRWLIPREAMAASGPYSFRLKADTTWHLPVADAEGSDIHTNARGFRGPTVASLADADFKVVSIGDSFTFGWGIPLESHCMSRFMSRYRADRPAAKVGHAFLASPDWGPRDYYLAFTQEVAPVTSVDVVIVGVFAGNDILPADTPRSLDPVPTAPTGPAPQRSLRPTWKTWQMMRALVRDSRPLTELALLLGARPAELRRYRADPALRNELWGASFFYLGALADAARRSGARLIMLSYPSRPQVESYDALARANYDPTAPDRALERFSQERGIRFIPLLDGLRGPSSEKLYWPKDRHLNPRGNVVCGELLTERLTPLLDEARVASPGDL